LDKWTGQIAQNVRALVECEFTCEKAVERWEGDTGGDMQ